MTAMQMQMQQKNKSLETEDGGVETTTMIESEATLNLK